MKKTWLTRIAFIFLWIFLNVNNSHPQEFHLPFIGEDVVFEEQDGIVAVEAEFFYRQTKSDVRQWYITAPVWLPDVSPDPDIPHYIGASNNAYIEILPDTRVTHDDLLITGVNFSNTPGTLGIVHYKVHFNNPGRYYVWVRAYHTGTEDNGIHVGFNDTWPSSGRRMQWCNSGKWYWESKQRTDEEHCGVPYLIYLDIVNSGVHDIQFSMREDGFEMDKWLMTTDISYNPRTGNVPPIRIKSGIFPDRMPWERFPAPDRKLSAYWNFNQLDGNTFPDSSGQSGNLVLSGSAAQGDGKYGTSIFLPENSQSFAYIENQSLSNYFPGTLHGYLGDELTVAAWIKFIKPDSDNRCVILSKESDKKRGFVFEVRDGNLAGTIAKDINNVTRTFSVAGDKTLLEADKWYHAAMTYKYVIDGSSVIKLYLDGKEDFVLNTSTGPLQMNDEPLRIGAYHFSSYVKRYFMGWIDELYVFNKTLTEAEITGLMGSEIPPVYVNAPETNNHNLRLYPNPVRKRVSIEFDIPEPRKVEIRLLNMSGREITTLINQSLPPGRHESSFDLSGMPEGLYLLRFQTEREIETRRMTIIN